MRQTVPDKSSDSEEQACAKATSPSALRGTFMAVGSIAGPNPVLGEPTDDLTWQAAILGHD